MEQKIKLHFYTQWSSFVRGEKIYLISLIFALE